MEKRGKKSRIEDRDEIKELQQREHEQREQAQFMGSTQKVDALEPDARAVGNAPEADGLAPRDFLSIDALHKKAQEQQKPLSVEQLKTYYGPDTTAPQAVAECDVDGKPVVMRVWAIAPKGAFMADRDQEDGRPLMAGSYVVRFDGDGRPQALAGCGSPFDPHSCLTYLRMVKSVREDRDSRGNKVEEPVYFTDQRTGRRKPLPSMPYQKAMDEIARLSGRREAEQSRFARLGGLVNRQRPEGGRPGGLRPSTPRGQRRDGGPTPHNQGR